VDLVINVPDSMDSQALTDGFTLRRAAVDSSTPLITDIKMAILLVMSLQRKWIREKAGRPFWSLNSWQEYTDPRGSVIQARGGAKGGNSRQEYKDPPETMTQAQRVAKGGA